MIDEFTRRQQCESVKQFEDGVAWLVDGHNYNSVLRACQSGELKEHEFIKYSPKENR